LNLIRIDVFWNSRVSLDEFIYWTYQFRRLSFIEPIDDCHYIRSNMSIFWICTSLTYIGVVVIYRREAVSYRVFSSTVSNWSHCGMLISNQWPFSWWLSSIGCSVVSQKCACAILKYVVYYYSCLTKRWATTNENNLKNKLKKNCWLRMNEVIRYKSRRWWVGEKNKVTKRLVTEWNCSLKTEQRATFVNEVAIPRQKIWAVQT